MLWKLKLRQKKCFSDEKTFTALPVITLTIYFFVMSQNDQTHFENLAANAVRFLKCVWPFYKIAK